MTPKSPLPHLSGKNTPKVTPSRLQIPYGLLGVGIFTIGSLVFALTHPSYIFLIPGGLTGAYAVTSWSAFVCWALIFTCTAVPTYYPKRTLRNHSRRKKWWVFSALICMAAVGVIMIISDFRVTDHRVYEVCPPTVSGWKSPLDARGAWCHQTVPGYDKRR